MVIGVTGGAGFIGTNLVRALLGADHEVRVLDDLSTGLGSNLEEINTHLTIGSVADLDTVLSFASGCEYLVHLGARGSVPRSIQNPMATHLVNASGTVNVLEAARTHGIPVVFSSSSSVYGRNSTLPKSEEQWTAPLTPYAASKLAGEGYSQAYANTYGLSVLTLRLFNIFGPWQRPDHDYAAVIPRWIWSCMNGVPLKLHGDGSQSRDFTYVSTAVDIITTAVEKKVTHPGPVNLAYGYSISLREVIELLSRRFPQLEVTSSPPRPGDVKHSQNDPKLIQQLFPNIQPVPFADALSMTIDWMERESFRIVNGPPVLD